MRGSTSKHTLRAMCTQTTGRAGTQVLQPVRMCISPDANFSTTCKVRSRCPSGSWRWIRKPFIFLIHRFAFLPSVYLHTQASWQPSKCMLSPIHQNLRNETYICPPPPPPTAQGIWFPSTSLPSSPATHPCSFCTSLWSPCYSCDGSSILLPQGLCTCCLLLSLSPPHSGLCSDVTFNKALSEIGAPLSHFVFHPHSLPCISFYLIYYRFAYLFIACPSPPPPLVGSSLWKEIYSFVWSPCLFSVPISTLSFSDQKCQISYFPASGF